MREPPKRPRGRPPKGYAWDAARGRYTLEDLQSTNGSKVNGKRVRSSDLIHGDELEIGHTKFKFLLKASEAGASA